MSLWQPQLTHWLFNHWTHYGTWASRASWPELSLDLCLGVSDQLRWVQTHPTLPFCGPGVLSTDRQLIETLSVWQTESVSVYSFWNSSLKVNFLLQTQHLCGRISVGLAVSVLIDTVHVQARFNSKMVLPALGQCPNANPPLKIDCFCREGTCIDLRGFRWTKSCPLWLSAACKLHSPPLPSVRPLWGFPTSPVDKTSFFRDGWTLTGQLLPCYLTTPPEAGSRPQGSYSLGWQFPMWLRQKITANSVA